MKTIASCSFGKDSIASIIVALEHGIKIDEVVYCRCMFTDTISAEYPEHEKFIHDVAIPKLRDEYGLKIVIVESKPYRDLFYRVYGEKSNKQGKIYGFPFAIRGQWCNSDMKMSAIRKYFRSVGEYQEIVGIACDETKRIETKTVRGKILPLVDYGITEAMAYDICEKAGLLSPAYKQFNRQRLGCWFCHNQKIGGLKLLRKKHPDLWGWLLEMQADSSVSFRPNATVFDLDKRFENEATQENLL
jgi:3'-phosphoadenosine 5'-phosphosulfate sulfotransferase (PAPS reductase)/FAD synthetase